MVIDYGNGEIATSIENVIRFGKTSMKLVISNILLVVLIFVVLNILYEIFLLDCKAGQLSEVQNIPFSS